MYGSDDGVKWTPLATGGLVFDYSRYMDISNREVSLPKNRCRQIEGQHRRHRRRQRIAVSGPDAQVPQRQRSGEDRRNVLERRPFRMDRIELWRQRQEKLGETERKVAYRVAQGRTEVDRAAKTTTVYVRTRREPLTELTLADVQPQFQPRGVVQAPATHGVRADWVDIASGEASLVDFGGCHKETLRLSFPEQREAEYRIVIRNEDNPPLKLTGVTARGNAYRVVLLAAEDEDYRLCYGADEVEPPKYDALAVLGPLAGKASRPARGDSAGKSSTPPSASRWPAPYARSSRIRCFSGAMIAALVAALGSATVPPRGGSMRFPRICRLRATAIIRSGCRSRTAW